MAEVRRRVRLVFLGATGIPYLGVEQRDLGEAILGRTGGKGGRQIAGLAAGRVAGRGHHPHLLADRVVDPDDCEGLASPDQALRSRARRAGECGARPGPDRGFP